MIQALIGPISELAGSFMQGQINKQKAKATLAQTKAEAEAEIMKTAATHDSKWEIIMAQGTQNSFKDELVTIVILIPTQDSLSNSTTSFSIFEHLYLGP